MPANAILLIYHHPLFASAPTIMEHVESFERYSKFKVFPVNAALGFLSGLKNVEFACIVVHYSLFGSYPFLLSKRFRKYIKQSTKSVKIAFFQDEYRYCQERFSLVNDIGVDVIYTLLESPYAEEVYYGHTDAKQVVPTLAGYICDSLIEKSRLIPIPFDERTIDVGYRARPLSFHMGRGAQEKTEIAHRFISAVSGIKLSLDIKTAEADRIYGDDWYRFVGNCKFMLGVEAGVSIFDLDGDIILSVKKLEFQRPGICFQEIYDKVLCMHEEKIPYRTISPRVFEAIIMKTGLILFEGKYSDVIKPNVHYIELKKDFSNIDEVLRLMQDRNFVSAMIQRGFDDVILSGPYHYRRMLKNFDEVLFSYSIYPSLNDKEEDDIAFNIYRYKFLDKIIPFLISLRHRPFWGRTLIKKMYHRVKNC